MQMVTGARGGGSLGLIFRGSLWRDLEATSLLVVETLHRRLLRNRRVSRRAKADFFSAATIEHLRKVFDDASPRLYESLHGFMSSLLCNPTISPFLIEVAVHDGGSSGAVVSWPRPLLAGLACLGAHADLGQRELLLSTLGTCPSLLGPYLRSLSLGMLEARPTYHLLQTYSLLSVVLRTIPVARSASGDLTAAAGEALLTTVMPAALSKKELTKGVLSGNSLLQVCVLCANGDSHDAAATATATATVTAPLPVGVAGMISQLRQRMPEVQTLLGLRDKLGGGGGGGGGGGSGGGGNDKAIVLRWRLLTLLDRYARAIPGALAAARFDFLKLLPPPSGGAGGATSTAAAAAVGAVGDAGGAGREGPGGAGAESVVEGEAGVWLGLLTPGAVGALVVLARDACDNANALMAAGIRAAEQGMRGEPLVGVSSGGGGGGGGGRGGRVDVGDWEVEFRCVRAKNMFSFPPIVHASVRPQTINTTNSTRDCDAELNCSLVCASHDMTSLPPYFLRPEILLTVVTRSESIPRTPNTPLPPLILAPIHRPAALHTTSPPHKYRRSGGGGGGGGGRGGGGEETAAEMTCRGLAAAIAKSFAATPSPSGAAPSSTADNSALRDANSEARLLLLQTPPPSAAAATTAPPATAAAAAAAAAVAAVAAAAARLAEIIADNPGLNLFALNPVREALLLADAGPGSGYDPGAWREEEGEKKGEAFTSAAAGAGASAGADAGAKIETLLLSLESLPLPRLVADALTAGVAHGGRRSGGGSGGGGSGGGGEDSDMNYLSAETFLPAADARVFAALARRISRGEAITSGGVSTEAVAVAGAGARVGAGGAGAVVRQIVSQLDLALNRGPLGTTTTTTTTEEALFLSTGLRLAAGACLGLVTSAASAAPSRRAFEALADVFRRPFFLSLACPLSGGTAASIKAGTLEVQRGDNNEEEEYGRRLFHLGEVACADMAALLVSAVAIEEGTDTTGAGVAAEAARPFLDRLCR
ncbi:unnamed protein product [Laminaria digitata]